jgi:hypothetical protein
MKAMHFAKTKMTPQERLDLVYSLVLQGKQTDEIRVDLGNVSRQRVHQLYNKLITLGRLTHEQLPKQALLLKKRTTYKQKWGHFPEESYVRADEFYQIIREKFRRKKASNYKHEWNIEFNDLSFPTHCPILGIELNYSASYRSDDSPSFDRIDSSKGYVKGNVAIMSWRANRIKNDGTAEEHQLIANFIKQFAK